MRTMTMTCTAAALLLAGCETTETTDGPAVAGGTALAGVESDKAQIQKSLSTMDDDIEREIAMEKMQWLIDNGLYDPENENPLPLGAPAPDFELMPLRFYDFQIDAGITKDNAATLFEPVRLSAFRGKLPVVLIFGSYT